MNNMEINKENIIAAAREIMENNIVATLSTCDNNVCHSNNIYYAIGKSFELIFVSNEDTIHANNIEKNSQVSVVIYNTPQSYGQQHQGIQISGTCIKAKGTNLINGWGHYIKRFPVFETMVKNASMIEKNLVKARLYIVKIEKLKIIDIPSFGQGFHNIDL